MKGGIAPNLELLTGPKTGDTVVGVSGGDVGPTLRGIFKFGVVGRMFGQFAAAGRNSCVRRIDGVWGGVSAVWGRRQRVKKYGGVEAKSEGELSKQRQGGQASSQIKASKPKE